MFLYIAWTYIQRIAIILIGSQIKYLVLYNYSKNSSLKLHFLRLSLLYAYSEYLFSIQKYILPQLCLRCWCTPCSKMCRIQIVLG